MRTHRLTLVLGGAASGKSEFAETVAARLGRRILYLAAAADRRTARTAEWRAKIARHRARRPDSWETAVLGTGRSKPAALEREWDGIILDSLSLWVSGRFRRGSGEALAADLDFLIAAALKRAATVVVSDEVGLGLVPPVASTRLFVECLGRANARVAGAADRVYLVVSSMPVQIK